MIDRPDDKPDGFSLNNGHGKPTHLRKRNGEWVKTPDQYRNREDGLISHVWVKCDGEHRWVETPPFETLEEWMFDSLSETPDGDMVEHDSPRSWLRILGLT